MIRDFRSGDVAQVKALYAAVHPDPQPRTDEEWAMYSILVACDGRWDQPPETWGTVLGYTASDLRVPGILRGVETLVDRTQQGRGIGRALLAARVRDGGDRVFIGATEADNWPMRHLLEAQGFVDREHFLYQNGRPGILYAS